eukprot:4183774-Amphidinium_carterae.2
MIATSQLQGKRYKSSIVTASNFGYEESLQNNYSLGQGIGDRTLNNLAIGSASECPALNRHRLCISIPLKDNSYIM